MSCWGIAELSDPSGSSSVPLARCGDDDLPAHPLTALEALRRALLMIGHQQRTCSGSRGRGGSSSSVWYDAVSDATRFANRIAFSGLAVLTQLRHDHLVKQFLVTSMLDDGSGPTTHAASEGSMPPSRKRPRGSAARTANLNMVGGEALLLKATGATIEEAEMHAMQRRPRVLRSNAKGSIEAWVNALQKSDLNAVLEFLALSPSASLLRCLCAVGFIAFWKTEVAAGHVPSTITVDRLLQVLVTCRDSLLTASLFQLLCAPDSCDDSGATDVMMAPHSLHMEGLVQYLFPTEACTALINVYWSPLVGGALPTQSGAGVSSAVPTPRGKPNAVTKSLRAKMLHCSTIIAPFFCNGVFGGMDVPRGAKYYPAAQQLLVAWCRVFSSLSDNKGDETPAASSSVGGGE